MSLVGDIDSTISRIYRYFASDDDAPPVKSKGKLLAQAEVPTSEIVIRDLPPNVQKAFGPSLGQSDNDVDAGKGYDGRITTTKEFMQAGAAICKPSPKTLREAEECLKRTLEIAEIKPVETAKGSKIMPKSIKETWGKAGITGRIEGDKIVIEGTLMADSANFLVDFGGVPIPKGANLLIFDLQYSSRVGNWGDAAMFTLFVNGTKTCPQNMTCQDDGMIHRVDKETVKVSLPIEDTTLDNIAIKTFAGAKIKINVSNLRFNAERKTENLPPLDELDISGQPIS